MCLQRGNSLVTKAALTTSTKTCSRQSCLITDTQSVLDIRILKLLGVVGHQLT